MTRRWTLAALLGPVAALLTVLGGCSSAGTSSKVTRTVTITHTAITTTTVATDPRTTFLRELRAKAPSLDRYQDSDLVTLGEGVCTYFGPNPALDREGHTDRYAYAVENLLGMTQINATEADMLIHAGVHAYCPVYDQQLARDGG